MSVVGIDVGNDTSCVALARKRGVDVLMNKESKRETPSMVSFGDKMRFLGTDAYGKVSMNPKNTPHQLKRLLGKKFKDPDVQADIARFPFKVVEAPDGGCLVNVTFCNEPASFTPEQLMAMLLVDLKKIAEVEGGIPVTDCVLSVPSYYTEVERYAMLNAAFVAGLNPLRLINETTATALAYGIYKTDLPETDPVNVVFLDMGHASTQVSVVAFKRSGLTVKCHAWDRNLGGRDVDEIMFDHFCKEVQAKQKLDIRSLPKAAFKLRTAVEKVKKILSANAEAALNVECIHEDTDVRGNVTREELEEWMTPLLGRVQTLLARALEGSGLQPSDISTVEVVGAATRVPAIFKIVQDTFNMTPSRTLNAKEVVSRGCALSCAMLSPVFKVRDYDVVDACPYAVDFTWDKDGAPASQTVFDKYSAFPSTKAITFMRAEPFTVAASYAADPTLPASAPRQLGTYTIGPFKVPEGADKAKLKVHFHMNLNGLVTLQSATAITEVEEEVPIGPAPAPAAAAAAAAPADGDVPMEDGAAAAAANGQPAAAANGPAPMEADAAAAAAGAGATEKKKKIVKTDVPVSPAGVLGYNQAQLNDFLEKEGHMQASDKLQEDTNEARNALESYIFELRRRLYEDLAPYVQQSDRESLSSQLNRLEDWLYEEGEDEKKSVYVAKLGELKALGDPIEQRAADDAGRDGAVAGLRSLADSYLALAGSALPAHAHYSAEDRAALTKEAQAALDWVNEKVALQAQLHKYDAPLLTVADIKKKQDVLERVCKPIADKKPPPPPKPAAEQQPAAPAAAAAAADGAAAAEPAPMEAEAAAAATAEGEAMEH